MGRPSFVRRSYKLIALLMALAIILGGGIGSAYALMNTQFLAETPNTSTPSDINRPEENPLPDIDDESVNFLVIGVDESELLTDVIMIINYNVIDQQVNVLQVPRDTYIGSEQVATGKINAAYGHPAEGQTNIASLIEKININFKLSIDHYVTVTLEGFRDIVDVLGGVAVDIPQRIEYTPDQVLEPGYQVLDGEKAEWFIRYRKGYVTGDVGRMGAQKIFMEALVDMVFNVSAGQAMAIASSCIDKITTDMTLMDMLGYYNSLKGMTSSDIEFSIIPGDGFMYEGYSVYGVAVEEFAELLNQYFRPFTPDLDASELPLMDMMDMKNAAAALQQPAEHYGDDDWDDSDENWEDVDAVDESANDNSENSGNSDSNPNYYVNENGEIVPIQPENSSSEEPVSGFWRPPGSDNN